MDMDQLLKALLNAPRLELRAYTHKKEVNANAFGKARCSHVFLFECACPSVRKVESLEKLEGDDLYFPMKSRYVPS